MNPTSLLVTPTAPSFTSLKRSHPGTYKRTINAANAPPLPKLTGDLILQVFTHRSLRMNPTGCVEDFGDNERLSELGKVVLEAVVTQSLYNRRPMLNKSHICIHREDVLSDENFEDWVNFYALRQKLRCDPDLFSTLTSPLETRSILYAYVGGVFTESGYEIVNDWINKLVEQQETIVPYDFLEMEPLASKTFSPPKKIKSEFYHQSSFFFYGTQPSPSSVGHLAPPPPFQSPVHPPPSAHQPNPMSPAQPDLPFLPLFNQTASQRGVCVRYPAEFSGPPHAGRWTVQCVVNGISKGTGTGSSKQVAKEEAARQAYEAMGWK